MNLKSMMIGMPGVPLPTAPNSGIPSEGDITQDEVTGLKNSIKRLDTISRAMWEVMQENGIPVEKLNAKIEQLLTDPDKKERLAYDPLIIKCPGCGKPLRESYKTPMLGKCVFCGREVVFYPYSDDTSAPDAELYVPPVEKAPEEPPRRQVKQFDPLDFSDFDDPSIY